MSASNKGDSTTRYYYDTEFIEDGRTIDLVSIGIVAEDGREYYAQANWFLPNNASTWVREHVLEQLDLCPTIDDALAGYTHRYGKMLASLRGHMTLFGAPLEGMCQRAGCPWRSREQMRDEISAFCDPDRYGKPELWGYYSAYDHVALCQLFGTMMNLPQGWPMYTRDLKQWCAHLGNPRLPEQGKGEHNALADARWNRDAWQFLHTYANH